MLASLLGGGLTLAILQMRKLPMPPWAMARDWIARLHDSNNGVPYGIALRQRSAHLSADASMVRRGLRLTGRTAGREIGYRWLTIL